MLAQLAVDSDPRGHSLHMYSYYGAVSWQILGIFLAAGFIVATLPFAAASAFKRAEVRTFLAYGLVNEFFAALLVLFGYALWRRYQTFAEKWALGYPYLTGRTTYVTVKEIIDHVEQTEWRPQGPRPIGTGSALAHILFTLAIAYTLTSAIFLFWARP